MDNSLSSGKHDPAGRKKKVLIVDDHPLFREGITQYINREPDLLVCGQAGSSDEALQLFDAVDPDLVIVDISLQTSSGIDLIKAVRSRNENTPLLVLSMHDETLYTERALRAGARGYVMKGETSGTIMTAIRRVLEGKIYMSEAMSERMLEKQIRGIAEQESPVSLLSDRELEVFQLIGQGVTTAQIAKNLHLSVKTVETYRANIKTKLSLKNNTQLIRYAVEWGQSRMVA